MLIFIIAAGIITFVLFGILVSVWENVLIRQNIIYGPFPDDSEIVFSVVFWTFVPAMILGRLFVYGVSELVNRISFGRR